MEKKRTIYINGKWKNLSEKEYKKVVSEMYNRIIKKGKK